MRTTENAIRKDFFCSTINLHKKRGIDESTYNLNYVFWVRRWYANNSHKKEKIPKNQKVNSPTNHQRNHAIIGAITLIHEWIDSSIPIIAP
jgi:hypothetical protein